MNENDLDLLLGTLDEIKESVGETQVTTPNKDKLDQINYSTNINILNESEKEPETNVVTPEAILDEYSNYDLKNEELSVQIEEIKLKNPEIFKQIEDIQNQINTNRDKQEKLKEDLKESLISNNQKSVKNDFWTVTYIEAHTKSTFDRESFEKKYPVLAKQFLKISNVSDSTRWTARKK